MQSYGWGTILQLLDDSDILFQHLLIEVNKSTNSLQIPISSFRFRTMFSFSVLATPLS
ncbi:MAG: hypothetical protein KBT45_04150 [Bacteroidales bacterium]|nr:hypothetical protein [Candidatus Colimorpha pelethequi]